MSENPAKQKFRILMEPYPYANSGASSYRDRDGSRNRHNLYHFERPLFNISRKYVPSLDIDSHFFQIMIDAKKSEEPQIIKRHEWLPLISVTFDEFTGSYRIVSYENPHKKAVEIARYSQLVNQEDRVCRTSILLPRGELFMRTVMIVQVDADRQLEEDELTKPDEDMYEIHYEKKIDSTVANLITPSLPVQVLTESSQTLNESYQGIRIDPTVINELLPNVEDFNEDLFVSIFNKPSLGFFVRVDDLEILQNFSDTARRWYGYITSRAGGGLANRMILEYNIQFARDPTDSRIRL